MCIRDRIKLDASTLSDPAKLKQFNMAQGQLSAALGKLITFEKKVKKNGAKLILTNIAPEIYQVFTITNLGFAFAFDSRWLCESQVSRVWRKRSASRRAATVSHASAWMVSRS